MKKFVTFIIVLFISAGLNAATTIWSSDHTVTADTTILTGDTLQINPGVTVEFTGAYRIYINQGTLIAQGTINDSIIFRHQTPGDRHSGIDFDQTTTTSRLEFCRIQDGGTVTDYGAEPWNSFGGGIVTYRSSPSIKNCLIVNNTSTLAGGGIFIRYANSSEIDGNVIRNNSSLGYGAGIGLTGSSTGANEADPTLTNNLIYNNSTSDYGGGLGLFSQCHPTLVNNILYGNISTRTNGGGGICLHGNGNSNTLTVTNCIFWANEATTDSSIANNGAGNTITVTYSDIERGYAGIGNINLNPNFIDISNFDFHLSNNSPCIDIGVSTGAPTTDFDGNATNQDGDNDATPDYDMGALEFLRATNTYSVSGSQDFSVNTFQTGASNQIASVDLSSLTVSGDVSVYCYTKSMPLNSPPGSKAIKRWYEIEEGAGLTYGTATITLYYGQDEFDLSGIASESNLTIWYSSGGGWVNKSGTWTNTADGGYVQITGETLLDGYWAFSDINDAALPVTLSSFSAQFFLNGIAIEWQTASEINNAGFELWEKRSFESDYNLIASYGENENLVGQGNSSNTTNYKYVDHIYNFNTTYQYILYSVSVSGEREAYGPVKVFTYEDEAQISETFIISNNYPNPFNPSTNFNVFLTKKSDVRITVYNSMGQKVEVIERKGLQGGKTLVWNANNMSAGIYFYAVHVNNEEMENRRVKIGKMILIK